MSNPLQELLDKRADHPDQRADEVFLGNYFRPVISGDSFGFDAAGFQACGWKSKRLGTTAYVTGGAIVAGGRPTFAKRSEIEEALNKESQNA